MSGPPPPIPPRPAHLLPPAPPPLAPQAPPPYPPPSLLGPLIADGSEPKSGVLEKGIKWQASGILEDAANMPGQQVYIQRPLTIHLGGPNQCIDEKGRQRTEILSWPPAVAGETWSYTWKFHLHPCLPSSSKFFHLMQLFSRESKGFVVALGFVQNKIRIASQLPPLLDAQGGVVPLPEIPIEEYWGRTVVHRCVVRWGERGSVDYSLSDAVTSQLLLRYAVQDVHVPAQGSIKFGLYRAHVCSPASAVLGDIEFRKLSG
ncbi:hypothetical protein JCM10908_006948 [Rhodotorula pacifica]|uniref:uncharacterized protein n=1 Tax=Rhodotorula pacifica TaxID=1495444 RepID=UPI003177D541